MIVQIDVDAAKESANTILTLRYELQREMRNIECLVSDMNGTWQGDAERALEAQIFVLQAQYQKLDRIFELLAQRMSDFAEEYTQLEEEIAAKINLA